MTSRDKPLDPKHLRQLEKDTGSYYSPVIKTIPKYPVIHNAPSLSLIMRSFRFGDVLSIGFWTASVGAVGYFICTSPFSPLLMLFRKERKNHNRKYLYNFYQIFL